MALKILKLDPDKQAYEAGLREGDTLLSINGYELSDVLDLESYSSDFELNIEYRDADGALKELTIHRELGLSLGIDVVDYKPRLCQNHCIFCFIDQMPPRMRRSLYVKDDDYRLSALYGNYITLTNLNDDDLQRICDRQISPLYISLHSTDAELRQKMMRSAQPVDALEIMYDLADCDIEFHVQFVVVPGYNDGSKLYESLLDLMDADLNIQSIGIVPVGLTDYREGLCELRSFDADSARELLNLVEGFREKYRTRILYPADEFYVLCDEEPPADEYYRDYPQLENGIGMIRWGYNYFVDNKADLLEELRQSGKDHLVLCSESAKRHISQVVDELNAELSGIKIRYQCIKNTFLGSKITVAGLLSAGDIIAQERSREGEIIMLPNSIFNHEGLTLDDMDINTMQQRLKREILLCDPFWRGWQRHYLA